MSGYKSEARRLNALCDTYERLVIAGHRMHRFFIRDQIIRDAYVERVNNNDWDEKDDRDDKEFLQLEGELWAKMYPEQADAEEAQEGENGEDLLEEIAGGAPHKDSDSGEELSQFFEAVV